jgi:hypothetical protein
MLQYSFLKRRPLGCVVSPRPLHREFLIRIGDNVEDLDNFWLFLNVSKLLTKIACTASFTESHGPLLEQTEKSCPDAAIVREGKYIR